MRFQTNDTVDGADANLVLSTLERNLLGVSLSVTRSGNEIRAYGIGPSPRPINAHNTSIFRAEAGQDGRILLTGDIEFQASALMDGPAQEPAVRSKIENVMRLTRAEVALKQTAAAAGAAGVPVAAAPPVIGTAARVVALRDPTLREMPASSMAVQPGPETHGAGPRRDRAFDAAVADLRQSERTSANRRHAGTVEGSGVRSVDQPRRRPRALNRVLGKARRYRRVIAAAAALVLLVATYLFGRLQGRGSAQTPGGSVRVSQMVPPQVPPPEEQLQYDGPSDPVQAAAATSARPAHATLMPPRTGGETAPKIERQAAGRPARSGAMPATMAQNEPRPAPLPAAPVEGSGSSTAAAVRAPVVQPGASVAEVRPAPKDAALGDRLEQWAASMRSTDAAQQASFYAGHLDRYFLKTDVSHDFVLRDKADFLRRGKRVELFDLEDVAVKDQTDSAARIRLVKHYVVLAGGSGPASEKMVRSELSLRKIDGMWEITGERDFK